RQSSRDDEDDAPISFGSKRPRINGQAPRAGDLLPAGRLKQILTRRKGRRKLHDALWRRLGAKRSRPGGSGVSGLRLRGQDLLCASESLYGGRVCLEGCFL